jgi:hypothetical protein
LLLEFKKVHKGQGVKGLAKYTQACYFYTLRYAAGDVLKVSQAFGPAVALNNGLPRIIPKAWRQDIRRGNMGRVKLCLTVFSIYRVLDFKGTFKLNTITDA